MSVFILNLYIIFIEQNYWAQSNQTKLSHDWLSRLLQIYIFEYFHTLLEFQSCSNTLNKNEMVDYFM